MRVLIGTVHRGAHVAAGGEFACIDWDAKRVVGTVATHPRNPSLDHDPNPRGNSRGCRGIAFDGDLVVAADYHTLHFLDAELRPVRTLSHGLMVGIHEILSEGDGTVWVTSTELDAVLRYDLRTGALLESYWPRETAAFQRELGLTPLGVDKTTDLRAAMLSGEHLADPSHLHLNAVATWKGEVYALFNAFGVIANLTRGEVAIRDPRIVRGHNLVVREDGTAFVSDTIGAGVRIYDLRQRVLLRALDLREHAAVRRVERIGRANNLLRRPVYVLRALYNRAGRGVVGRFRRALQEPRAAAANFANSFARPLFVRGLALAGERLFVGVAPATVICLDWQTGRFIDQFIYSWNVNSAVHGLAVSE